jgi:hypothetical protein
MAVDIRVVNLRTELPPIYHALGYVETGTEAVPGSPALKPAHFIPDVEGTLTARRPAVSEGDVKSASRVSAFF